MRSVPFGLFAYGFQASLLFTPSVFADPPAALEAQSGIWRLVVLDGKSAVKEDSKPQPTDAADAAELGQVPGTAHVWTPAAWGMQLGATKPKYVFRTYFGPSEGRPVPGDFNGDGCDELAVFLDGKWHLDFNGNNTWEAADVWVKCGAPGDLPIVGDWNQDGKTDIGIFTANVSPADSALLLGTYPRSPMNTRFTVKTADHHEQGTSSIVLCTDHECVCRQRVTHVYRFGAATDVPVVGDWNGNGKPGIGTFRDGLWTLDLDGDGRLGSSDVTIRLGEPGDLPIVGDFNRDGTDELGIYRRGLWHLDTTGDRILGDDDLIFRLGDANDIPVVGDWDGDGRDQIGIVARGESRSADSF